MTEEEWVKIRKSDIAAVVRNEIMNALAKELPHECWTCRFFDFPLEDKVPRNKSCQYPGKLEMFQGVCNMWDLQPDPNKRRRRIY